MTHQNTKDGDSPATVTRQSSNVSDVAETAQSGHRDSTREKVLPADQQTTGTVNYLGSSYSGADIKVYANLYHDNQIADTPGDTTGSLFFLGTLQTISIQSHREKFGVRALGHSYVKGYTRGPRTIAGSMIFTIFHEYAFAALLRKMAAIEKNSEFSSLIADQMPPLDLMVRFANEYGQTSEFRIYGLEILSDGATYSIEDLLSENVMQFTARDVDPLADKGRVPLDRAQRNENHTAPAVTASSLYNSSTSYQEYLNRLHVRRRLMGR